MFWVLIGVISLLTLLLAVSFYYLIKFVKIIFVFEDDLSDAIEGFNAVENKIQQAIDLQVYFDSPEVQKSYVQILEEIKIARAQVSKMAEKFVQRSKRKYITIKQEEPSASEFIEEMRRMEEEENSLEGRSQFAFRDLMR